MYCFNVKIDGDPANIADQLADFLARKPASTADGAALAAVKTTIRGAIHALDVCNGTFKIEQLHTACSLKVRAHDKARQSLRIATLQDLPASGDLVEITAELIPNSNGDFELHVFDAADIAQLTGGHSAND